MRIMIQQLKDLLQWAEFSVRHSGGNNLCITAKTANNDIWIRVFYDSHEHLYTVKVNLKQNSLVAEGLKSHEVIKFATEKINLVNVY